MMFHGTSNIIKSFQPIFYISKYFGSNLYQLPKVLTPSNLKINPRPIDVFICFIQFSLTFGVTIPMIRRWDDEDSPIRKELESKISLSSVVILSITGSVANYAYSFIFLFIIISDMLNAPVIRSFILLFANIDEKV